MLSVIHASMAIPGLYGKTVFVNDEECLDGSFDPFPIQEIIDRFNPTDILVLPNHPFKPVENWKLSPLEAAITAILLHDCSLKLAAKAFKRKALFREGLKFIAGNRDMNIGVLWPPDVGINQLTIDGERLKSAAVASFQTTCQAFGIKADVPLL